MQQLVLHSRAWTALPGCLHGVPQATLLGQLYVGPLPQDGLVRVDQGLKALDDLSLRSVAEDGPLGLLHRIAHLVEAVQCLFGHPVSSAFRFIARGEAGHEQAGQRAAFDAALPYHHANSAIAVIVWAVGLINEMVREEIAADDASGSLAALGKKIRPLGLKGINSVHFVRAAYQLDVPVAPYTDDVHRYGTGFHTRAILSALTDRTSALGMTWARDKWQAAQLLEFASLPTGRPQKVNSADEAVREAERIGYPVVLKPNNEDSGVGVRAGLADAQDVRAAYPEASAGMRQVLIEKHFAGQDYRLTVHGDEVLKVEQRVACSIVGDGLATVAELVQLKQDTAHLRRIARETGKVPLSLDDEALGLLASAGLTAESVPDEGRRIPLRRQNNISTGGEQVAVSLSQVHPDNAALAVRAAKLLLLDIAGVDLIVPDISRSWRDDRGIICEVNATPQIGVRTTPGIYREMLQRLLGPEPRIPAFLLTTSDGGEDDLALIAKAAEKLGCNGVATRRGMWLDGQRIGGRPAHGFAAASSLLRDPDARSALCVLSAADVRTHGLPLDRFDTIIVHERLLDDGQLLEAIRPHTGSIVGASTYA